jgi:flap endonuclease-1
MGTTGFWSFYHDLIQTVPLDTIKGKILFIDIILYIHKYVIGIRKSGYDMKTKDGKVINHIYALCKILKNFMEVDIFPIPVFDGKSPDIKEETIEKRKEQIGLSIEKCNEIIMEKLDNFEKMVNLEEIDIHIFDEFISDDEYIKHFKRSFILTPQMIQECKNLLDKCGIPYVNSIGEADSQCVGLYHYYKNISSGNYSEDSDILLYFGAEHLYRNIDIKNNTISVLYVQSIVDCLQKKANNIYKKFNLPNKTITREILIDFSIIMGNDYCNGIRISGGNNRDRLFELFVLAKFNVEDFVELLYLLNKHANKIIYYIPELFLIKWNLSKKIYNNVDILDPKNVDIRFKKSNPIEIRNILQKYNIRSDIIEHFINALEYNFNTFNQTIKLNKTLSKIKIDDWIYICGKKIDF